MLLRYIDRVCIFSASLSHFYFQAKICSGARYLRSKKHDQRERNQDATNALPESTSSYLDYALCIIRADDGTKKINEEEEEKGNILEQ